MSVGRLYIGIMDSLVQLKYGASSSHLVITKGVVALRTWLLAHGPSWIMPGAKLVSYHRYRPNKFPQHL